MRSELPTIPGIFVFKLNMWHPAKLHLDIQWFVMLTNFYYDKYIYKWQKATVIYIYIEALLLFFLGGGVRGGEPAVCSSRTDQAEHT